MGQSGGVYVNCMMDVMTRNKDESYGRGAEAACNDDENTMSPEALPFLTLTNTMVYRMRNNSTNNIGTMLIALFLFIHFSYF